MARTVNLKKVVLFIALTYVISFGGFYIYKFLGGTWGDSFLFGVGYMYVPLLAALLVQKLIYRAPVVGPLGISFRVNRWFIIAAVLPVIIIILAIGASLLVPNTTFSTAPDVISERLTQYYPEEEAAMLEAQYEMMPIHPFWIALAAGLLGGVTINAVAAFGEELGWRGLLFRELMPLGFWKSSLIIGGVWGFWHFPVVLQGHNYPQNPIPGVFLMVVFTILMAPVIGYVTLRARSVIAASVFHGVINGIGALPLFVVGGGTDLTVGLTGVGGFVALLLVNFFIWQKGEVRRFEGPWMVASSIDAEEDALADSRGDEGSIVPNEGPFRVRP